MAKPDGEGGGNARSDSTRKQRWPDEIVSYLRLVQRTFENELKKYHEFLQVLVDRKHRRINIPHLIKKVRALFKEHKELINEFYQFLPEKYIGKDGTRLEDATNFLIEIKVKYLLKGHPDLIEEYQKYLPSKSVILAQSQATVMPAPSSGSEVAFGTSQVKKDDAWDYLQRVKERFQDQQGTYMEFLFIMRNYDRQRIDTHKLVAAVRDLFRGNNDLIQGFDIFLPEEYRLDEDTLDFNLSIDLV